MEIAAFEELDKAIKILSEIQAKSDPRADIDKKVKEALKYLRLLKRYKKKPTNTTR